jgi:hypothetical protein
VNPRLFESIEIAFWDTTIPVLTQIKNFRRVARDEQTTRFTKILANLVQQILVWSAIGLIFGLFLGLLGLTMG